MWSDCRTKCFAQLGFIVPKVSIVLPVYNGEQYLEQSLESIVGQSFDDWELIIVDDCSSDGTPDIINRWKRKDPRISSYRNNPNKKLPGSLNEGFKHASGQYFTWTSDDNIFRPNALEIMVSSLDRDVKADLVYCDIDRIDENGDPIPHGGFNGSPSFLYLFNVVQACFLYRSEVHRKLGGYDESLFLVEDYDFWLRAYRNSRFIHLKDRPYLYRMHSGSLTSTRQKEIRERACYLMRREASCKSSPTSRRIMAFVGLVYNTIQCRLAK